MAKKQTAVTTTVTTAAVQPSTAVTPAAQPEVKPVAAAPLASVLPAAEPAVSKQQKAIMELVVALRQQRQIEVKPEMLVQDGKFINVVLPNWPVIVVGTGGGFNIPAVKSYAKADLATRFSYDDLLGYLIVTLQFTRSSLTHIRHAPSLLLPHFALSSTPH